MRVSALIIASAHANVNHSHRRVARQADDDRRYFQLVDMMENYNPQFDERKYWAYGCNCLILGEFNTHDPALLAQICQYQFKMAILSSKMTHISPKRPILDKKK